jgi:D-3-phosphoglycerate dehydrogenase / 2-oxoglutarate reductase
MPNVICTPHIGGVVITHLEAQYESVFGQILAYAAGQPINVVNPEALGKQ